MAAKENESGAVMGKLVRDKIPEIIKNDGKTPIIEILSNEDYLKELDKKLDKMADEYKKLADHYNHLLLEAKALEERNIRKAKELLEERERTR